MRFYIATILLIFCWPVIGMARYMTNENGGYFGHLATVRDFPEMVENHGHGSERDLLNKLIEQAEAYKKGIELRIYFPKKQEYLITVLSEYGFTQLATEEIDNQSQILMTKTINKQE